MKKNRVSESTSSFDEKQSEFGELTAEQKAELKNKYGATGEISSTDALAILSELVDMKIVPGRYATMAFEEYAPAVDGIMVQRVLTPPEYNFGSETLLGMLERSMRNMQSLLDTSPTYLSGEPVKIDRERAEEHIKVQEKIRDLIADIMKD
jgi:hypothetical protein